jgi:hypothetical protein
MKCIGFVQPFWRLFSRRLLPQVRAPRPILAASGWARRWSPSALLVLSPNFSITYPIRLVNFPASSFRPHRRFRLQLASCSSLPWLLPARISSITGYRLFVKARLGRKKPPEIASLRCSRKTASPRVPPFPARSFLAMAPSSLAISNSVTQIQSLFHGLCTTLRPNAA